ncbi:hypothetical protein [Kitasatospora sp. NPDC088134]|uniref:hypothetical protein n=1 Tax=Kitasatospora sp. NPDC088134 TaxID=3364071 RepID=UPI0038305F5D
MTWAALLPLAGLVFAVLGAFLNRRHQQPRGRHRVKMDLELLALLPEESGVKDELREHIDGTLRRIIGVEGVARRDAFGIGVAALFLVVSVALFVAGALTGGAWWWFTTASLTGAVGVLGMLASAPKRLRDLAGRPIGGDEFPLDRKAPPGADES